MSRPQSIVQAMQCVWIRRGLVGMIGCPVGGCGETDQARRRLAEMTPHRSERDYAVSDLIEYALYEDRSGRWAARDDRWPG